MPRSSSAVRTRVRASRSRSRILDASTRCRTTYRHRYVRACLTGRPRCWASTTGGGTPRPPVSAARREPVCTRSSLTYALSAESPGLYHDHGDDSRALRALRRGDTTERRAEPRAVSDTTDSSFWTAAMARALPNSSRSGLHARVPDGYPRGVERYAVGRAHALDRLVALCRGARLCSGSADSLADAGYRHLARLLAARIALMYQRLGEPTRAVRYRSSDRSICGRTGGRLLPRSSASGCVEWTRPRGAR
jgi:hypothetical protein